MYTTRRRKQKSNKLRLRCILWGIIAIILLIIRFITRSSTSSNAVQRWSNLSWTQQSSGDELSPTEEAILKDLPLTWIEQAQESAGFSVNTWEDSQVQTEDSSSKSSKKKTTSQVSTWTGNKSQNSDLFPVDLCNRIVKLYQCIIEQAPIENQDIMQQNLKKSINQRTLLASPQLSEVCQKITQDQTFVLVKDHYATWDFNCTF